MVDELSFKDRYERLKLLRVEQEKLVKKAFNKLASIEGDMKLLVYKMALENERKLKELERV